MILYGNPLLCKRFDIAQVAKMTLSVAVRKYPSYIPVPSADKIFGGSIPGLYIIQRDIWNGKLGIK